VSGEESAVDFAGESGDDGILTDVLAKLQSPALAGFHACVIRVRSSRSLRHRRRRL